MNKSLRNKLMVGLLCGGALSIAAAAVAQAPAGAPGAAGAAGPAGAGGAAAGRGGAGGAGGRGAAGPPAAGATGSHVPSTVTLIAMQDAVSKLPAAPPAKPKPGRKILVLAVAKGFVHTNIPLAAATVKELGDRYNAWSTDVSWDAADINPANLAKYDAVFLDNTTGDFLDVPTDPAATAARRQALLDFVRSGKGLMGIHAAGDSYHGPIRNAAAGGAAGGRGGAAGAPGAAGAGRGAGGAPGAAPAAGGAAGGGAGRAAAGPPVCMPAGDGQGPGHWPEFNHMIGGFFKFHWVYPQIITVKIDDKKSPLTAMFNGQEFTIHDETYTFNQDSWSRTNVHVLTSIDYDKMSQEDRCKEQSARTDHDFGLSWIRAEGKGRVFYEALGHDEHVYAMPLYLQHILAGFQYALGDLKADDSPSVKAK